MEGNQQKMREALVKVLRLANVTADGENWDWNNAIAEKVVTVVNAALSAPARNCDVGTAEEQAERQSRFCISQHGHCKRCPAHGRTHNGCVLAWAQMPYAEEGGAQ